MPAFCSPSGQGAVLKLVVALIIIKLHDWLFPGEGNSQNFLRTLASHDFDFLHRGENVFAFNNRLLAEAAQQFSHRATTVPAASDGALPAQATWPRETVAEVDGESFTVSLIPETLERTTLGEAAPGRVVNLEVDVLAKYVEKLVAR